MIVISSNELFTTRKRNTVEWPKMHNFENGIYQFFRGIHPRISILGSRRFAPRSPLVANRNLYYYRTWDICVGKRIYVTILLGIFSWKTALGPFQVMIQRGCADTLNLLEKINLPLKESQKSRIRMQSQFIDNYF